VLFKGIIQKVVGRASSKGIQRLVSLFRLAAESVLSWGGGGDPSNVPLFFFGRWEGWCVGGGGGGGTRRFDRFFGIQQLIYFVLCVWGFRKFYSQTYLKKIKTVQTFSRARAYMYVQKHEYEYTFPKTRIPSIINQSKILTKPHTWQGEADPSQDVL